MGLTNSFGGCIITVNMPAPTEVLRSGARLNQSGSIAALNLFESRAKRDALIDRVVSFGTAVPKSTTSEIPVLSGEVLKAPVALDYTTGVINVTPPIPEDPRKDLSHDSVKNRRPSLWRRALITGVAVASGLTAVGTASPSPTEASGNMKLVTASSEGINCVEDKSLLVIDFKYAAELVKGIASGEIVIAVGPAPVAALEEGDKTAVVEPITISQEEVWQNLVKVVPECPPVVVEPTPTPTPEPTPMPKPVEEFLTGEYPDKPGDIVGNWIEAALEADPEAAQKGWFGGTFAQSIKQNWKVCKNGDESVGGDQNFVKKASCIVAAGGIYKAYAVNRTQAFIKAFKGVVGYAMHKLPRVYTQDIESEISANF